jgi:Fe-S-cluster-containing hydrogenase component 2
MDAITADDGPPKVSEERCIGCGLCVSTCPSGAMSLRAKVRRTSPPKETKALYIQIFKERFGPLGTLAAVAGHLVGRKF